MKRIRCPGLFLMLCALVSWAPAAFAQVAPLPQQRLEALYALEADRSLTGRARGEAIAQRYRELLPGDSRAAAGASDAELAAWFDAAHVVIIHQPEAQPARDLVRVLAALEARGLAEPAHYHAAQEGLLAARLLDEAQAFTREHAAQGLAPLPTFVTAPGLAVDAPSEWAVHPQRHELLRRPVSGLPSTGIVVVGHPFCHFTQDAVRDIEADPLLAGLFAAHAKWIAPQSGRMRDVAAIQQWNRDHPDGAMTLAYRESDWPAIDYWGTPTFYFLRDGQVVEQVTGWPTEGRRAELLAGLRELGLLPADGY